MTARSIKTFALFFLLYQFIPYCTSIAGGIDAELGDTPYHLQLRYYDDYLCSAALIISKHGNQVVVTAGHCVTKSTGSDLLPHDKISVIGGRTKINGYHYYEQYRGVTKMIRHADWKKTYTLWYHDVVVIHLDRPFDLNRIVYPIDMPTREQTKPNDDIVIAGWGYTNPQENDFATNLQISAVQPMSNHECTRRYAEVQSARVGSRHFCGGTYDNPTFEGPCNGDDGSPAASIYNNSLYLAGVFNYKKPRKILQDLVQLVFNFRDDFDVLRKKYGFYVILECGNRFLPAIFTDFSYYINWIHLMATPIYGTKNGPVPAADMGTVSQASTT